MPHDLKSEAAIINRQQRNKAMTPNIDTKKLREVSFPTLTLIKLVTEWQTGKKGGENEQDYVIAVENQIIELLCHNKEAEAIAATMLKLAEENERLLKVEEFTKKFTRIERGKQ